MTRKEQIQLFIIKHIEKNNADIAKFSSEHFNISRQAINKYLKEMVDSGILIKEGTTRNRKYKLAILEELNKAYYTSDSLEEHIIFNDDLIEILKGLPKEVVKIWDYCLTEMLNNALSHSGCEVIIIKASRTAKSVRISICDNGIGIFKKIQKALNLKNEQEAVFELYKGKLTTAPAEHSGEGIFFTSRMLDNFNILSGDTYFRHDIDDSEDYVIDVTDFIIDHKAEDCAGTLIVMELVNDAKQTMKEVFDRFAGPEDEDHAFYKTIIPVKKAEEIGGSLISRSQAKRLLTRSDKFKSVVFDFKDVEFIGQAFADQIFRVFANANPAIKLEYSHVNDDVLKMIKRALHHDDPL